jgi:aconitase A
MISKSYEKTHGDSFIKGGGLPFELPTREEFEKTQAERQKAIIIDLDDLNGQDGSKGMPKNFVRKAGRVVSSFTDYWAPPKKDDGDIQ